MGKLKDQMIEEMSLRNYSPHTIKSYTSFISQYVRHFNKSPLKLDAEHVKGFLSFLIKNGYSWSSINQAQSALIFLYKEVLKESLKVEKLKRPKSVKKLPEVLNALEVERIINCCTNLKHRMMLLTAYSTGVRVSELCSLKLTDIDSKRMMIKVEQGKGRKDRYTVLSSTLLAQLREYYKKFRPAHYLFNSATSGKAISVRMAQHAFLTAKRKAGIVRKASVHTLRHCFATELLNSGTNIFTISKLLGHNSIKTTTIYLHLQQLDLSKIINPIDQINIR
jgi:integrase/recombinase XerD